MDIDKQKVEKELENIKYGIYDKYYHNIFKYLSEHTFEREDAKRILQIEKYKITDDFIEIIQNDVKFIIDYKNEECYIGIKYTKNEYHIEQYQKHIKTIYRVYNSSNMKHLKDSIVRIVFHYNLMIQLLAAVIFKTQELYLTVSSDIFDFNNIQ